MSLFQDDGVDALLALPEGDAARELIRLYRVSFWRTTKLKVVRALSQVAVPRSLEFLMRIAVDERDLSFCEEAIWALGRSRKTMASRFLVHLYEHCSPVIRPHVIGAIGESLDSTLVSQFLAELAKDGDVSQSFSARNIALALSELKDNRVEPWLERIVKESRDNVLVQSAILGLSRVSRSTDFLDSIAGLLQKDIFLWQLGKSVRSQIQFRSQWKLEDYLQKTFEGDNLHPSLPFELNGFLPADVHEGLGLFTHEKYFARMCFALARVNAVDVAEWYVEFLHPSKISSENLHAVCESVSHHHGADFKNYLVMIGKRIHDLGTHAEAFASWVHCIVLSLPKAEELLQELCVAETFDALVLPSQVVVLNELANHAVIIQQDVKRKRAVVKIIDGILSRSSSNAVRARALRSLGQIQESGNKTHEYMREASRIEEIIPSVLFFCEKVPSRQCVDVLVEVLARGVVDKKTKVAILKAFAEQRDLPASAAAPLESFLTSLLSSEDVEVVNEALLCAAMHPRSELVPKVKQAFLRSETRLAALVAARSLKSEELVDAVAACLCDDSEVISGRALDVLTLLPGARSKRVALDHFVKNPLSLAVADKIIRSLEAPSQAADFFAGKVAEVLIAHPEHQLREGLVALRERFISGEKGQSVAEVNSEDMKELDAKISARILGYAGFDGEVKAALRAAEMPFHRPEMFQGGVDKSTSAVAFCKAIDLMLEKQLGKKLLFPKFEHSLHEFQNIIHTVGLSDNMVSSRRVREVLRLDAYFTEQSFPLHKMTLVAQGILSGRIVFEQWRILDGLRAWAVVILLFGRGAFLNNRKPLICFSGATDQDIVQLARRLLVLQDLRNPAAHRETWLQFPRIEEVRTEVAAVFREWQKITEQ